MTNLPGDRRPRHREHRPTHPVRTVLTYTAAAAAVALAVYGALHTPTAQPGPVDAGLTPAAPAPSTASSSPAAPAPTPPPAPRGPSMDTDSYTASEQASDAATGAVLAYFHSDSRESGAARAARLAPLFVPGARELTDAPLLTPDGAQNTVTDAQVTSVEPTGDASDTEVSYLVAVTWSVAWWPDDAGGTGTYGGQASVRSDVVYQDGAWLVSSITSIG